jgi:hypothetical protein
VLRNYRLPRASSNGETERYLRFAMKTTRVLHEAIVTTNRKPISGDPKPSVFASPEKIFSAATPCLIISCVH